MPDQRVLIVDDEQRTLLFLRESLVAFGLNVETTCVSSAEEALEAFNQQPFDVVIADVLLQEMTGLQLLERLRQSNPNLRVILVSGYRSPKLEATAHALGVYRYFQKPFALDEFTSVVTNALREAAMDVSQPRPIGDRHDQFIHRQLTALMRDTGAQCVLLTDHCGSIIAQVGKADNFDGPLPVPATGPDAAFNFAYHQGKTYDFYSADVGNGMRLNLIFDRNQPGSRIGLVLQYTRRAVQELAALEGWSSSPPPD